MRISCDYCGASFDTAENSSCPKCGGAYGKDDEMNARVQTQLLDEKKQELEEKQAEIEQRNKKMKVGTVALAVMVMAIVIITVGTLISGSSEAAVMLISNFR